MNYNEYLDSIKNDRKNQAIMCTAQLYLSKGISAIKMTDIADESQIGVASLYRYFKTKRQLTIEVGIYLWNEIKPMFEELVNNDDYKNSDSLVQIDKLAQVYKTLYNQYNSFLRFIDDFDRYVVEEKITSQELSEYENSVFNFYGFYAKAIKKGRREGLIRTDFDSKLLYFTTMHSLMALCRKLSLPKILKSDFEVDGESELSVLIDAFNSYIKK